MTKNKEWEMVCKAYCKKIGAELLFVNDYDFGYEKDGNEVENENIRTLRGFRRGRV